MLAKSKPNSINTLISQVLIDMDISHEEFVTILNEKDRYGMMKEIKKIKMENHIKLLDLIVLNQKLKIIKHIKWKHIV